MTKLKCPACHRAMAMVNQGGEAVCTKEGCAHREPWQPAVNRELAWRVARL